MQRHPLTRLLELEVINAYTPEELPRHALGLIMSLPLELRSSCVCAVTRATRYAVQVEEGIAELLQVYRDQTDAPRDNGLVEQQSCSLQEL